MKKFLLIIFAVMFFILSFVVVCTNHKGDKNIISRGYLILDFEDNEGLTASHIYDFSNNEYTEITQNDYERILEYHSFPNGYYCIKRTDIYGDEQRAIILKTANADICIPTDLTTGNIRLKDNRVFYLSDFYSTSDDYELCFVDTIINEHNSLNKRISSYCLFGESIYYVSNGCLFSNNFNLNNEKEIQKNCKFVYNTNSYLIIQTDDKIYKFDPIKNETITFSDIRNYNIIATIDDNTIIISKQNKQHDELDYQLFKTKKRYYILSDSGKKTELSELRGKTISKINYVSDAIV